MLKKPAQYNRINNFSICDGKVNVRACVRHLVIQIKDLSKEIVPHKELTTK